MPVKLRWALLLQLRHLLIPMLEHVKYVVSQALVKTKLNLMFLPMQEDIKESR